MYIRLVAAVMSLTCCFTLVNCARNNAESVSQGLAPFTGARAQAVALIVDAKHSLGAQDLNTLALAYSDLQQKANAYANFLVQSSGDTSFDSVQNTLCAENLRKAIVSFNKAFATISPSNMPVASVRGAWVTGFSTSVSDFWNRNGAHISSLPADTKVALVAEMRSDTLWPNYENIATETIAVPSPR
jgi:hypothetical protein